MTQAVKRVQPVLEYLEGWQDNKGGIMIDKEVKAYIEEYFKEYFEIEIKKLLKEVGELKQLIVNNVKNDVTSPT